MKRTIFLPFLLISAGVLTGCTSKDNPSCNEALIPQVTVNTPVTAGSPINLTVSGIENVLMYNWHGPNGFYSHEENPVIPNASANSAGRYTVDVITKDGCIHTAVTDSVIVGSAQAPCNLNNNTATLNGAATITLSYVYGAPAGGSYFIDGSGSGGDVELEFNGTGKPVTGVYTIQPTSSSTWGPGNVRVNITAASSLWYPAGGKVYVTLANNKVTASFCDVEFSSLTWGFKTKGSLKLTER